MYSVSPRKNRSRIEIMAAILEKAVEGAKKTQMMYGANLSFYQIEGYIEYMIKMGFLSFEKESGLYWTTSKGREFLKGYENMKLPMNSPKSPNIKPLIVHWRILMGQYISREDNDHLSKSSSFIFLRFQLDLLDDNLPLDVLHNSLTVLCPSFLYNAFLQFCCTTYIQLALTPIYLSHVTPPPVGEIRSSAEITQL